MQADHTIIRAVMNPDNAPYSWYENGKACGIVAEIFVETAKRLGLDYEIISVSSKKEYEELILANEVDIWMDVEGYYEGAYKTTKPYLTSDASILRRWGASGKIKSVAVLSNDIEMKEIVLATWPKAEIVLLDSSEQCIEELVDGKIDGALLLGYRAQKIARDDTRNRFQADIVPNSDLTLRMGINSKTDIHFWGIWDKMLSEIEENRSDQIVQTYLEEESEPTLLAFLYAHPAYFVGVITLLFIVLFIVHLYINSTKVKNEQMRITQQLANALEEIKVANAQLERQYRLVETGSRETAF